jgi:DNA-binding transcriptional ArsR family regulator
MPARGTHLATVHALADPNRMRIVELLREGPLSVGAIAERLGLRQPQTSKHLKVLADGGIVHVTIDANRRIYALRPEPFLGLDAWLQAFRPLMEERFDNLDDYLRSLADRPQDPDRR